MAHVNMMHDETVEMNLVACCGSQAWIAGMLARRPYGSLDAMLAASDEVFATLQPADWLEAFAHHPAIGQQRAAANVSHLAEQWSGAEQATASTDSDDIRSALAHANAEYNEKFGFLFIICATGKSGAEILSALNARMGNERDDELSIAAHEQRQITRLRLKKL